MLILTRRIDEAIIIDDDITVTLLDITGNQVSIGIHAPEHVPVHRKEVWQRIQRESAEQGRTLNPEVRYV